MAYRWRLRRRPTEGQRSGQTRLIVAIAAEEGPGPALIVRHLHAHPGNAVGLRSEAVTPREIVALIREGIAAGWTPTRPGPAFELTLRGRVVLPSLEIPPLHRSEAALAELARARTPASLDRLEIGAQGSGISINGVDLVARVRAAELPHAIREVALRKAEGDEIEVDDIAGAYIGLQPHLLRWPSRALVDLPSPEVHAFAIPEDDPRRRKATLLECTCGISECWFLLARITLLDEFVVWSEFEQFHRPWRLELGPFVFARRDYFAAIGAPAA